MQYIMTIVIVIVKQIGQSTSQYPNILYEYKPVIGDFVTVSISYWYNWINSNDGFVMVQSSQTTPPWTSVYTTLNVLSI